MCPASSGAVNEMNGRVEPGVLAHQREKCAKKATRIENKGRNQLQALNQSP